MGDERSTIVVCDAGPLIHLDELGCLNLLSDFAEVLVPVAVWHEVRRHRPAALSRRGVPLEFVDVLPDPSPALKELLETIQLQLGEEQALRVMQQFPQSILLTDDGDVKGAAEKLGYQTHGTIGVLLRARRVRRLSQRRVLRLLRSIPERSTLHLRAALLESIIEQVMEESP